MAIHAGFKPQCPLRIEGSSPSRSTKIEELCDLVYFSHQMNGLLVQWLEWEAYIFLMMVRFHHRLQKHYKINIMEIRNMKIQNITNVTWEKFYKTFDFENSENNFKYDFKMMTKKYGRQFIEYCKASWLVNCEDMTEENFCKMNANMPIGFFKSKIKMSKQESGDSDQT